MQKFMYIIRHVDNNNVLSLLARINDGVQSTYSALSLTVLKMVLVDGERLARCAGQVIRSSCVIFTGKAELSQPGTVNNCSFLSYGRV